MDKEQLVVEYKRYLEGKKWMLERGYTDMARAFNRKAEEVEEKIKKLEDESRKMKADIAFNSNPR